MRAALLLPLLAFPLCASAQSRVPVRVCAWNDTALVRHTAYYAAADNRLFAAATGEAPFALAPSPAYARDADWYVRGDTVEMADGRFTPFRSTAVMEEASLVPAGALAGVPLFRRANDRVETLYALVGPGVRTDTPRPYTDGGRCEFQPYRRLAPVTASAQ